MTKKSKIVWISFIFAVILTCVIILTLYLSGVIFIKKHKITDFEGYGQFESAIESIEVVFRDEHDGEFVISDTDQIKNIQDILLSRIYVKSKITLPPGSNISLTFNFENGAKSILGTRLIMQSDRSYYPMIDDGLDQLLLDIGLSKGVLYSK